MAGAVLVVLLGSATAVLGGWVYFRRYRVTRPPIGVIDRGDVAFIVGGIILVPYLYLWLWGWLVAVLLGLGALGILALVLEPVLASAAARWPLVAGLVAADVALAVTAGAGSNAYFAVNNLVLLLTVVGVANLWAQSGMRARDAAVLGGFLAAYDLLATALSSLTVDMIGRLTGMPFLPVVAWAWGDDAWLGIGLGDLLFATVFPLVTRKAFGLRAGALAAGVALATIAAILAVGVAGWLEGAFPVMTVLGPLMVLQYAWWTRRIGPERTTREYLIAEPLPPSTAA